MSNIITIDFHGDVLFAVEQEGAVFVALKPIVIGIGLDWEGQHLRLRRDAVLGEGIVVTKIPSAGGTQETVCLRLDLVNGWLFTIDDARVKDDAVRQRVLTYKRECYRVLFEHFYVQVTAAEQPEAALDRPNPSLEERRQWLLEIVRAEKLFGDAAARDLWRRSPLPQPAETGDAAPAMFSDIDQFLAEKTRRDTYGSINAAVLYKIYQKWCDGRETPPMTQRRFGLEVRKRGIIALKSGTVRYLGISLVSSAASNVVGSATEVLQ